MPYFPKYALAAVNVTDLVSAPFGDESRLMIYRSERDASSIWQFIVHAIRACGLNLP